MAGLTATQNYLVPASGSTHGYPVSQNFSATPFNIDFRNVELDGQPFVPSGVFVDNSAGIGDLVVTVAGFNYSVVCPAGGRLQAQYPAPVDQSATITGNGQASVVFVDFPVIPFLQQTAAALGNVGVVNGGDVAEGNTADAAAATDTGNATVISLLKRLNQKEGLGVFPFGAAPFSGVQNGANAVLTVTLPAVAAKTNYISGIWITGAGATSVGLATLTITGAPGGTLAFTIFVPVATEGVFYPINFPVPLAASAQNVALVASVTAFGAGNGSATLSVTGYTV